MESQVRCVDTRIDLGEACRLSAHRRLAAVASTAARLCCLRTCEERWRLRASLTGSELT